MLVGRDEERAAVDAMLEDARRGRSRVLVLTGEAGIGKSALLDYARERAVGMSLLRVTGVESEAELAFAALHALLRPVVELIDRIPERQRESLSGALALRQSQEPDRLGAYAGTLSVLGEAAAEQPVLVLVDDAHWLDRASAEAITFAARRIAGEDIALLVAIREGEPSRFDHGGLPDHRLSALGREESLALLHERHGAHLNEGVAASLAEVSAGNPLALIELPSALSPGQLDGRETLEEPIPVGERLQRAFMRQVKALPEATQKSLLVAAAGGDVSLSAVLNTAKATGGGALEPAEAAGLIELTEDVVTFRHPLIRSTVYSAAAPARRRAAHRALADALKDHPDQAAWQLAAAAEGPDDKAAAALEAAADRAVERGGHAARARALERAAELSSDPVTRAQRLCAAARAADWAGQGEHAIQLCERALPLVEDPLIRADLLHQLVATGSWHGRSFSDSDIRDAAASMEALDPERAAKLFITSANDAWGRLDYARGLEVARLLERLLDRLGPWWRPRVIGAIAEVHVAHGDLTRAHELYDELLQDPVAASNYVQALMWVERYDDARHALAAALDIGRKEGNLLRVAWAQCCSAVFELTMGRITEAATLVGESLTLSEALDVDFMIAFNAANLALIEALRGRHDACEANAARVIRLAPTYADDLRLSTHLALGVLALTEGRAENAVAELEPVAHRVEASGLAEVSLFPYQPELIESYVRLGRTDDARTALQTFERQATSADRRWALAAAARCHGLLAEPDELETAFELALERHDDVPSQFERARTELAYGERLRRANRRRDARPRLRTAYDLFDRLGALPWRDRAGTELRATGERLRRSEAPTEQLTPQELQIALLVAEGKTNREIGASIFLSPKTVEFHLTRVYRKLDVNSRRELIRQFSSESRALDESGVH